MNLSNPEPQPFVLLPLKTESVWGRVLRLIRWPLWPFKVCKKIVNRHHQQSGSRYRTSQMSGLQSQELLRLPESLNDVGGQLDLKNRACIYSGAANAINQHYGSVGDPYNTGIGRQAFNSFVIFTHRNPPSLKQRFDRAFRAFVNAWRSA